MILTFFLSMAIWIFVSGREEKLLDTLLPKPTRL